jgi:hypothetical protein
MMGENLYKGYEGPFVECDEWYIGLQAANSGRLTLANVLCIVAPVFSCKYFCPLHFSCGI